MTKAKGQEGTCSVSHNKPAARQETDSKFSDFWLPVGNAGHPFIQTVCMFSSCARCHAGRWGTRWDGTSSIAAISRLSSSEGKKLFVSQPGLQGEGGFVQCRQRDTCWLQGSQNSAGPRTGDPRPGCLCLSRSVLWAESFTSLILAPLAARQWADVNEHLLCRAVNSKVLTVWLGRRNELPVRLGCGRQVHGPYRRPWFSGTLLTDPLFS